MTEQNESAPSPSPAMQTARKLPQKLVKRGTDTKAPGSKSNAVIALLSRKRGASIAEMMKVTGWQQHSVRGFLAGTVKKKLGHELSSQMEEDGRVYRIAGGTAAS